jgi:hypothetical protein
MLHASGARDRPTNSASAAQSGAKIEQPAPIDDKVVARI